MKKALVALGLAVLLALLVVGTAAASSGPTMAQFKSLKARVALVESRLACFDTIGVSQYDDFGLYDLYDYSWDWTTGLDLDGGSADFAVVIDNCA